MSDEYSNEEDSSGERFTSFWPLFILIGGLLLWSAFQGYSSYRQNSNLNAEIEAAAPTVKAAQEAQTKLYALAQDLLQTGTKDTYAAQIIKEANIQVRAPATNAPDASAPASSSPAPTNAP
jgi:predicted negative regulator of RcsB-dependent stress response